jgi:hypothetical protein
MATVFFCYIRVSQRVWANAASQEKLMDPMKLKKSRSVHLRATIHSCVQIILVIFTLSPHLYQQILEALSQNFFIQFAQPLENIIGSTPMELSPQSPSSSPTSFGVVNGADFITMMMGDSSSDVGSQPGPTATIAQEELSSTSSTTITSFIDNHLARLIGITINYSLLILG